MSTAQSRGYKDITIYNQEVYHYEDSEITKFLDANKFDLIGLGIYGYHQYRKAINLCKHIDASKNKPLLVLGSHGPTAEPEHFLKKMNADVVVMGEGEIVFCNLLDALSSAAPLSTIKGIAYREGENIFINEREAVIKDIDTLSYPAWDMFPMEHYVLGRQIAANKTDRCMSVVSSRGCMYSCNFCFRMYKGYRLRDVGNVIEEIKKLIRDYHVTFIIFEDENLTGTKERVYRFAEAMIKADLSVRWSCHGRLRVATPDILDMMKRAGCVYINYGIESLDQKVLDLMDKHQTVEEAFIGVENTIKAGICPGLNVLWGNLGDTKESLQKAKEFLNKYNVGIWVRNIKPVTPYPGAPLFNISVERGLLKDAGDFYKKYSNSDKMTVNFTDISDEEFYKLLFEANKEILSVYYKKRLDEAVEGYRRCYFENDVSYRGPRHL